MKVLILMGSESDMPVMQEAEEVLREFGIPCKMTVASAHRSPERVLKLVKEAERKGADAIICGAGMAAHLAGVVASHTVLPVIGVPLPSSAFDGLDALLSTVQMPPGIPVATVALGSPGAKNAAYLAVQIIARKDRKVAAKVRAFRRKQAAAVEKQAKEVEGK